MRRNILKDPAGLWLNTVAFAYAIGGYVGGLWVITASASIAASVAGVALLAHAQVISAYLVHELAHGTIFADPRRGKRIAELLLWLTGASYARFEEILHKHFRHHADRADVVMFDFRPRLAQRPLLLRLIQALEWAYVPAVDLLMHALAAVLPFHVASRRSSRVRVLKVLGSRVAFLAALAAISPSALLSYAMACVVFLHVMRFMDVHQHTYEIRETLERPRGSADRWHDRAYEHRNTYSNLISLRRPWLNLLVLNFGYHNAHHVQPGAPWYRLPALHARLKGEAVPRPLPLRQLLTSYHRYRVRRVLNGDDADIDVGDGRAFVGVIGVSFLMAH